MLTAIDTHAHVYPERYLDMIEKAGVSPATTKIARGLGAYSTPEDISRRLRWMDEAGVEKQVLAVTPQVPPTAEAATWINDEYARLIDAHPDRFLAYGALPLTDIAAAVAEVPEVFDRGFVGVSLPTVLSGQNMIDDPAFDPLWVALDRAHAIVNIHPTGSGLCSHLVTSRHLEWVNGAPIEDATTVLALLKANIPARYPNITFHIAHLGGDLAFLFQRIEDNYADWNAFPASPQATLRGFYFDAANFYEPALRLAVEAFGASQILAGSDFPYFQEEKYVRAFDYVRGAKLDESVRAGILRQNATKLYLGRR
ncbi:amidohydrolase family protein [Corynebacterium epidermidicanis]|uniref:Putative TIM-barrel fold metal-dependent hydrolase n=1 Tax=Corynebacterium epidermidicanis TaxID=1050174 RepID=A0A0G3GL80_9CORY|nr:amidohydrolase family protein [Corynebacterium epidermidicanis]AKK01914.1 putative TIM-barrel fold metal-dependent hydrolase [Corynebacterium epidermidicanis]